MYETFLFVIFMAEWMMKLSLHDGKIWIVLCLKSKVLRYGKSPDGGHAPITQHTRVTLYFFVREWFLKSVILICS